jgi:glycosyltransferase involved in cell wall biosynthesis
VRVALVLNDFRLSGGVNVVLQYASRLAHSQRHEVTIIARNPEIFEWALPFLDGVTVTSLEEEGTAFFDVAIATYWETVLLLGQVPASNYVWFCQLYEDRFFPDRNPNIATMQVVGSIPLPVITEASWIQALIQRENPDRKVELVLNGIDKSIFFADRAIPRTAGSFTVLIEGPLEPESKGTVLALEGTLASKGATHITHVGAERFKTEDKRYRHIPAGISFQDMAALYRTHHLLVKTPVAEGMFGPPLEAFHCGTPAIVTAVSGSEEYIQSDKNSIVVGWSDPRGVAQAIDELAANRRKWESLSRGALATAAEWPDWDSQAARFEVALASASSASKLSQADLANLSRTILFSDLMHWLAMRKLSDKNAGPGMVEEVLAINNPPRSPGFRDTIRRFLRAGNSRP